MKSCDLYPQIIHKPSHDLKQQLSNYSKRVAGSVTELIQSAEAMKGTTAPCVCHVSQYTHSTLTSSIQWIIFWLQGSRSRASLVLLALLSSPSAQVKYPLPVLHHEQGIQAGFIRIIPATHH